MTKYLTTDEVAAELRKTPDYVRRLCSTKQLRAKKLGNDWRITPAALDAFMNGDVKAAPARPRLSARQRREAT